MTASASLAAFVLTACLGQHELPDSTGLPAPRVEAHWAQTLGWRFLLPAGVRLTKPSESEAMLDAVLAMQLGPGQGWFQPGRSRLGWPWLAERMDVDGDGRVTPEEFTASPEQFTRLDRNGDGVLTAADFDWSVQPPPPPPPGAKPPPGMPSRELLLKALFRGELGSPFEGPYIGQRAPRFTLPTHDSRRKVFLDRLVGRKPVVLIFGSLT